jgi:bifunctional DNA-binding transcriptional regulator/antitoxin component of YhaV-PrlF toxin-antitoxin module
MFRNTGISRPIDNVGRIVIPIEFRSFIEKSFTSFTEDDTVVMEATRAGIRGRKLDPLGRFCMPIETRRALAWETGDKIEIHLDLDNKSIKLKKV